MKKRLFSIVLTLCMVLALMPQMVFAEDISGVHNENVTVNSGDIISGGTFNGQVENEGTINGGIFNGTVNNPLGTITNGIFNGEVTNLMNGTISGGTFKDQVTNRGGGRISGGTFNGAVNNIDGVIIGGTFNQTVYIDNIAKIEGGVFYGGISGDGDINSSCCSVTFKNEGSDYAVEVVKNGSKAAVPDEPTKDGYKFTGWYTDKALNNLYNFDMPVNDELILYAGWKEEKITLTVPFTTTVEVSGNASPGETTFNLEVVDSQGNELQPNDYNVKITASVETDGAGDYNGNLTFTGTASAILRMFDKERDEYGYIYVKQAGVNDSNWDVDEAAWGLFHRSVVELSDEEVEPSPICIFPAVKDGTSYHVEYGENGVDKMTFVNKYASSAVDSSGSEGTTNGEADKDSKADAEDSAKTGDDTNLALWLALMLLAGAGITGTTIYTRRKRTNE
ncbi:InlB B-repeat-containing protein [Mogibacterium kristiansenii]|uniref:InlB B-repeat-containing protein n=1 Tax=Mogibacterium kristiansenii TaxID=2606708 RepID=UPI00240A1208|nr:InlB B-repeat-containing protein [Mogibacterium kristiansenii]MDD6700859.1 InlB B-repeat-containing protein [Mogibacterium kristiansenii]